MPCVEIRQVAPPSIGCGTFLSAVPFHRHSSRLTKLNLYSSTMRTLTYTHTAISHHTGRHWALATLTLTLRVMTLKAEVAGSGVKVVVVAVVVDISVEWCESQQCVNDVVSTHMLQCRVQCTYCRPITCNHSTTYLYTCTTNYFLLTYLASSASTTGVKFF